MNDSMSTTMKTKRNARRSGHKLVSSICLTALGLSALVVGGASSTPVLAQTSPMIGTVQEIESALLTGGLVKINPGTYRLRAPLDIRIDTVIESAVKGQAVVLVAVAGSRVINVGAKNAVIDGLTITGGSPTSGNGGGINVAAGAMLRLVNSSVTGNTATDGGGISSDGTLEVENSTINQNTATGKGGGIRDNGGRSIPVTTAIVNSTFNDNTASQGGAFSSAGRSTITHATIVGNKATSSSSAGVDRNGGTLVVRSSIIGANVRTNGSAASDCSGTPELRDVNLISNTSGCNPINRPIIAPPMVAALAPNGGPTLTMAPLDGSEALNKILLTTSGACSSGLNTDQRKFGRPGTTNTPCDIGAFERGQLGVAASLRLDTSNYQNLPYTTNGTVTPLDDKPALPDGTVEVGVTSVPTARIAAELAVRAPANTNGTVDSAGLRAIGLRAIGLRSITLEDIGVQAAGLRAIEVKANGLRSIGLRAIGLRAIGLRAIGLRAIGLRAIPLSEIPLLKDGGWDALLKNSQFAGVPLQSITLEDISVGCDPPTNAPTNAPCVVPADLTLESIDLSSTGLRAIALQSILLSGTGLRAIPLPAGVTAPNGDNAKAWCLSLFDPTTCTTADGTNTPFVATLGDANLWEAQLAGANVGEQTLTVPLAGLTQTALNSTPSATGLRSIGLRAIGLRSIFLENTGLRAIGLRQIGLRAINGVTLNTIIDCGLRPAACSTDPTNTLTLGDVVAGCLPAVVGTSPSTCLLRESANVGQLLDLLGVRVNNVSLLDGLNLFDILFAFVPPEDVPWEAISLEGALLQNVAVPAQPTFDYITTVTVTGGFGNLDVSLMLPVGFAVAAGANAAPATWCPGTTKCEPTNATTVAPTTPLTLGNPKYRITGVAAGVYQLRVPVRAGLTVGPATAFPTKVAVTGVGGDGVPPIAEAGPVGVRVVEAVSGGPRRAPVLNDGQLQLGHIGSSNDVDVYSFKTPPGATGASARILLSNIPEGVDYDLSVYGPQPASLRGTPTRTLNGLGDVKFDLDPGDDALSTDIANDIAIDINQVAPGNVDLKLPVDVKYALRDISSRRSDNDEEVTIPALVANQTYVVVVSGYFGDLSPQPYGLRVRLDRRTALPAVCAASTIYLPAAVAPSGTVPDTLTVTPSINTLYVTNSARLNAEFPGRAADVISAIGRTDEVNGVQAGLLLVDDLSQWNAWNSDSCSPDARNAVVKAVGAAIDGANSAKNIKNIVIVGGDGVIPMGAVPDLTEYSNESTFAREVLSPSVTVAGVPTGPRSNSLSGTVGNGYLLSDNPYATDAGISILGGDHELYVPDRAIGRLVETADDIIRQLQNFKNFDGRLDPTTFNNTAAVTGYDFLNDGAQAVSNELSGAGFNVTNLLQDTLWDKAAYLQLLAGKDYSIISPNAHYDFESLLPAAADARGYFTANELVTTQNVRDVANSPVSSLIFTVGCHAGLSVSDVQLGFPSTDPTLDWAQLNGAANNQYVAHTTYGYGDTVIVAYSERLAQLFAKNISAMTRKSAGASPTLGAAVRDAKQQYLASTLVLTPYDEKVVQSWTYYGLPMYTLGDLKASTATTLGTPLTSTVPTTLAATPVSPAVFGTATSGNVPVTIDLLATRLQPTITPDGTYYSVNGNTIVAQYRPVQPLVNVAIPTSTRKFGGFLITGLTSEDLPSTYKPFVSRPIIDNSADEGRIVADDDAFPATLQRITDIGDGQRLLIAAGQYETNQRLFREIRGQLLPRAIPVAGTVPDTVAPRFIDVVGRTVLPVGTVGRGGVQFDIVTDTDATRVVVVYREGTSSQWKSIELATGTTLNGRKSWFGSAALSTAGAQVEFFAQSADASGNVGITSNKIKNFLATEAKDPTGSLSIVPTIPQDFSSDGQFVPSGTKFVIRPSVPSVPNVPSVQTFSVDSGTPRTYNSTTGIVVIQSLTGTTTYEESTGTLGLSAGAHVLFATDLAGNRVYRFFVLDPTAPVITFTPDTTAWQKGPVSVTVTATDGAGSGVTELCVNGPCTADEINGDGIISATALIDASAPGVAVTATDRVGNFSQQAATYKVDNVAPVITFTPDTTAWQRGPVNVTVSATDDSGSGVRELCVTIRSISSCVLDASPADTSETVGVVSTNVQVDRARSTGDEVITANATDVVGNTLLLPRTTTVRIDNVAPSAVTFIPNSTAWTNAAVPVSASATDVGSEVGQICFTAPLPSTCAQTNPATTTVDVPPDTFASVTVTATASDKAGNPGAPASTTVSIDKTLPLGAVTNVKDADGDGLYAAGEAASVTFSCTDTGSLVAKCELLLNGAVVSTNTTGVSSTVPVNLTTTGTASFSVRATDFAGNGNGTTSVATSVNVGYGVCPMYDSTQAKSIGSNYTIKLRLCDGAKRNLSSSAITLTALTIDGTLPLGPNFQGSSNVGFVFRFNATDSSYIYNLETNGLPPGDRKLFFTTGLVPSPRPETPEKLQPFATNFAPFNLR